MSDALRDALVGQLAQLPQSTPTMAASWPLAFAKVSVRAFTPFGVVDLAGPSLVTEWQFEYDLNALADLEVEAMFTGLLSWIPADSTLRLESFHHPSEMLNVLDEDWPAWMPIARILEYRSLDVASVFMAITGLVARLTPRQREVIDANAPALVGKTPAEIATEFMAATTAPLTPRMVLPVLKGDGLGSGAASATGKRFAVRARERDASPYFVNLAYHAKKLRDLSFLPTPAVTATAPTSADDVRAALVDDSRAVIGTGTVRTVAAAGAAHTSVRAAVMAASAGDLVLVTDATVYPTPTTIEIDKPLVITSTSTADARTAPAGLPTLRGVKPTGPRDTPTWQPAARRVIGIAGKRNGQATFTGGVIQISNLIIDGGAASHGGGIWVDECPQVLVDNVRFQDNEAFGGGWLYEGFGGGLATRHAGILVKRSGFFTNGANCRGGGMGVFGYGWPIILDCVFQGNQSRRLGVQNPVSGNPFLHRPDGGGLGIQMATPNTEALYAELAVFIAQHQGQSQAQLMLAATRLSSGAQDLLQAIAVGTMDAYWDRGALTRSRRNAVIVKRCRFTANTSQDDGGGIYTTGLVRMRMRDCELTGNKADTNGGGLRISTACDAVLQACTFSGNESNAQNRGYQCEDKDGNHRWQWIRTGGGAIAARTSNLRLVDVTIHSNQARRYAGGGIFFTSTDDGALPGGFSFLRNDWNDVRDILVRCGTQPCPEFRFFSLVLEGATVIRDNACGWTSAGSPTPPTAAPACGPVPSDWNARDERHAKGGGIYALRNKDDDGTVYPPIKVSITSGSILRGNTAAFSPTATELFIADLNATGATNPSADTSALARDPITGALTAPYAFVAAP